MHAILITNQVGQINVLITEPTDWAKCFFFHVGQVRQFVRGLITHIFCVAVISDIGIHEVFDLFEVIEIFSAYDPCSNV